MPRLSGRSPRDYDLRWGTSMRQHVAALAWSPDGRALVVGGVEGALVLCDGASGAPLRPLAGHAFGLAAVGWSPDGARLASAGQDGKVRVWDPATGEERRALDGGATWVDHLAWSPDGALLATAAGKRLRLWDAAGRLVREWADHGGAPMLASAAPGAVRLWRPDRDEPVAVSPRRGAPLALAWSPDGRFVATGGHEASVHLWDAASGKSLQMAGYPAKVRALTWDGAARSLASGGGGEITVWDCGGAGPRGRTPAVLEGSASGLVTALAYRPGGTALACGTDDGWLTVWPPRATSPTARAQLDGGIATLAWSPDGRLLAVGGADGDVTVVAAP